MNIKILALAQKSFGWSQKIKTLAITALKGRRNWTVSLNDIALRDFIKLRFLIATDILSQQDF